MQNKLFPFSRLNPRLQGILGGLGSLVLLVGMVSLSMTGFENAAQLSSNIAESGVTTAILNETATEAAVDQLPAGTPGIAVLTPTEGVAGDTVFLVGTGLVTTEYDKLVEFTAPRGTTVRARTVEPAILEGRETLRVVVPEGAVSGPVTLTMDGLKFIAPQTFTVSGTAAAGGTAEAPQILALSKTQLSAGDQLLVTGTGLSQGEALVKIGGVPATIVQKSEDTAGRDVLLVTASADAMSGFVTVDVAEQTAIYQQAVTITNSAATAPQIDASRHRILPAVISEFTDTISLYTFISDPDGLADIISVNVDLSALGGSPSNEMLAGLQEGNGRIYGLEGFFVPDLLEANTEYRLPITATDINGQLARDAFVICVGDCSAPEVADDAPEGADMTDSIEADPNQPINLTSRIDQGLLRLDWEMSADATDVTGYFIYYAERAGEYTHRVPAGAITSYYLEGITPLTQYHIAVSSVDAAGNESEKSASIVAALPLKTDDVASSATVNMHGAAPAAPAEVESFDYSASKVTADESMHGAAQPVLSEVGPAETLAVAIGISLIIAAGYQFRRKTF